MQVPPNQPSLGEGFTHGLSEPTVLRKYSLLKGALGVEAMTVWSTSLCLCSLPAQALLVLGRRLCVLPAHLLDENPLETNKLIVLILSALGLLIAF